MVDDADNSSNKYKKRRKSFAMSSLGEDIELTNMQGEKTEHHLIVRLWRLLVLSLYFAALFIGIVLWILTGGTPGSTNLIIIAVAGIILTALAVHSAFSINILGRMRELQPDSEKTFVYLSALGLYMAITVAIVFGSIPLMRLMQIPEIVVALTVIAELVVFLVVGYRAFNHLKQQIEYHVSVKAI